MAISDVTRRARSAAMRRANHDRWHDGPLEACARCATTPATTGGGVGMSDDDLFTRVRGPVGEWAEEALCANHPDQDLWFPERGASTAEAKAICRVCPVQQPCLEYAIANGEKFGIWGGRSERERRRIRRGTRTDQRGTAA